jgi:alpha-tubulin suppressor-like RCC1 family protein
MKRYQRGFAVSAASLILVVACLSSASGSSPGQPGTPRAWGANPFGQLGDGTTTSHPSPLPVTGLSDAIDIAGGRGHVIALRAGGTVWTWGSNDNGQIGNGTLVDRPTPAAVAGLANITEVAAGHYHSMALRTDGTVWTWGLNASGQLGDGTTTRRTTPVQVSGLTGVAHIAGGRDMSYALKSDGTVWAWGLNTDGELGDGTLTSRRTPVRVGALTNVVAIAGGRDHGLAVLADGTVRSWGDNQFGQLGDGTLVDRSTPVQIAGLTNAVDVAAGAHHSVALRADGTVFTWGRNNLGQIGDGTATMRPSPVQVSGLSGVVSIGCGRDHVVVVLADGTARAWGRNDFRQLGDGSTTNRTRPVTVNGLTNAVEAEGGQDYSVALTVQGTPDTSPPTTPGRPAGTSSSAARIDLTWSASTDQSPPITYRVYRDGGISSIGQTTGTTFADSGLTAGSIHTYTVDAVDAATNVSQMSPASDPITVFTPVQDTTPPTQPGKPSGQSLAQGTINLSWGASHDDVSATLTYRIFRDGALAGSVNSASVTTVSFADTGLAPGSAHTYVVVARDAAPNESPPSDPSDAITVMSGPTAIFTDDFSSGTLSNWAGVTRVTIDSSQGAPAAPSARIQVSGQTAFARRAFAATAGPICVSERVNVQARGTGTFTLARFLTSSAAGIVRVYVNSAGALALRSDVAATTRATTVAVGSGWVLVELCGSVGASSSWDLYRNGVKIVSAWVANTGTTPVAQVQIGDTAAITATMNLDDVVVDQAAG